MDTDFRKLFKIKVEFEETAPINEENVNKAQKSKENRIVKTKFGENCFN